MHLTIYTLTKRRIVFDKSHSQIPSYKRKMDANTNYYFMTESGRGEGERKTETERKKRLLFGPIIQLDHRHNCLWGNLCKVIVICCIRHLFGVYHCYSRIMRIPQLLIKHILELFLRNLRATKKISFDWYVCVCARACACLGPLFDKLSFYSVCIQRRFPFIHSIISSNNVPIKCSFADIVSLYISFGWQKWKV